MKRLYIILILFTFLIFNVQAQIQSVRIESNPTGVSGLCYGSSLELSAVYEVKGVLINKIEWSPTTGVNNPSLTSVSVSPTTTTNYRVTVYADNGESLTSEPYEVIVVPAPEVIAPKDSIICINTPFALAPKKFINSQELTWTIVEGNGKFSDTNGQTSTEQSTTFIPDQDYTGKVKIELRGTGTDYCTDVVDYTTLTYKGAEVNVDILTAGTILCSNEPISVKATASNYKSFIWVSNKGAVSNQNTLNPQFILDPKDYGDLKIQLIAHGDVCTVKDSVNFTLSKVNLEHLSDIKACEGEDFVIWYSATDDLTFNWNTGETTNKKVISDVEYDDQFIVLVENEDGCTFVDTINMTVFENPKLDISYDFEDKIITVSPENLVRYIFKSNDQDVLFQDGLNNIYSYENILSDYDSIYIEVYNENCLSAKTYQLPFFKKVNVFTPNGDNINDRLMPGRFITVFDRSSNLLYEGWDGWDGTSNGREMPQGTYFYILYTNEGDIYYKGPVTIIREQL